MQWNTKLHVLQQQVQKVDIDDFFLNADGGLQWPLFFSGSPTISSQDMKHAISEREREMVNESKPRL